MVKAVVFDLDDTLISEMQYIESGFESVSEYISCLYKIEKTYILNTMKSLFQKSPKQVFNRLLEHYEIDYTDENIMELVKIFREHIPKIEFYNDVIPVLRELRNRGLKLGIITDGYKETQIRKLNKLNSKLIFDRIIINDELGREYWKPNEASYILMAKDLKVKLNEMVYVGDNVEKDFISANVLGMYTVQIKRENGIYQNTSLECSNYGAKVIIDSLYKLLDIVKKI